jgi:hypothetical protein
MKQLVVIIALGIGTSAAFADQEAMSFGQADANSDGAITRDEAASFAALEQQFDEVDTNSNGLIELLEFSQLIPERAAAGRPAK